MLQDMVQRTGAAGYMSYEFACAVKADVAARCGIPQHLLLVVQQMHLSNSSLSVSGIQIAYQLLLAVHLLALHAVMLHVGPAWECLYLS